MSRSRGMAQPGHLADAVGALVDLGQSVVDLLDRGPGLGAERQVALALDGQGVALARLLVELDVARLALLGQRVGLGLERFGLAQVGGPLLDQRQALHLEELELGRRRLALGPGALGRGLRRGLLRRGRRLLVAGAAFLAGSAFLAAGVGFFAPGAAFLATGVAFLVAGAAFFAGPSWPAPSWPPRCSPSLGGRLRRRRHLARPAPTWRLRPSPRTGSPWSCGAGPSRGPSARLRAVADVAALVALGMVACPPGPRRKEGRTLSLSARSVKTRSAGGPCRHSRSGRRTAPRRLGRCRSAPSTPISTWSPSRRRVLGAVARARRRGRVPPHAARTASPGSSTRVPRRPTAGPGCTTSGPACSRTSTPGSRPCAGRNVPRKGGWDCHGLPVELEVEKELGLHSKHEIEAYGVAEFNQRCRDSVQRYVEDWSALTTRSGTWIDTADAYWTLSNDYVESVWWLLSQLWQKGLLYEGHKVSPYCARCGTALSSHELGQPDVYRDVVDPSVYVRFPLVDDAAHPDLAGADLLVWTTTPWTLISNVAAAVGPDIDYARVPAEAFGSTGRDLLVAVARLPEGVEPDAPPGRATSWSACHYRRPFTCSTCPPGPTPGGWSRPTTSAPTTAPASSTRPPPSARRTRPSPGPRGCPCSTRSTPTAPSTHRVPQWQGLFVKDADRGIIADLAARGPAGRASCPTPTATRTAGAAAPRSSTGPRPRGSCAPRRCATSCCARTRPSTGSPTTSSTGGSASGSRATSTGRCRATATGARPCPSGAAPAAATTAASARSPSWPSWPVATWPTSTCTAPTSTRSRSPAPSAAAPAAGSSRCSTPGSTRAPCRRPSSTTRSSDADALPPLVPRRLHLRGHRPDPRLVLLAAGRQHPGVRPQRPTATWCAST